ncbi:MAG TPA: SelB C-terminal domain-containing protein, partial [Anaerolineaceae bacterium]
QWAAQSERAARELEAYHRLNPLRRGMPREELKSRLKIVPPRQFNAAARRWQVDGLLEESGSLVWRTGHSVQLTPQQKVQAERLLKKFAQAPFAPPSIKDAQAEVGEDVFAALVDLGYLVSVSAEVAFRREDYDHMVAIVLEHFAREDTLTAAQLRDTLNTSRRYALAFLEYLDAVGVTAREGDFRRLKKPARA